MVKILKKIEHCACLVVKMTENVFSKTLFRLYGYMAYIKFLVLCSLVFYQNTECLQTLVFAYAYV